MVGRARYDRIVHRGGVYAPSGAPNARNVAGRDHVKWIVRMMTQTAIAIQQSVSIGAMFMTRTPAAPSDRPSTSAARR
jgi:hypothetical protein